MRDGDGFGMLWVGLCVLAACSAETGGMPRSGGANGGGTTGASDPFANSTDTAGGSFGNSTALPTPIGGAAGAGAGGLDPFASGCGGDTYEAQGKALEIYVLFDNSGSWIFNNWPGAQTAFNSFITDPASAGIGVALKWYGESCDPATYATPDVPMGLLPTNASPITAAVTAMFPLANTTTEPALAGGLEWASARYASGLNVRVVMLLITDGNPDPADCSGSSYANDIPAVANVAAQGFAGEPSVPTYVLGVGDLPALNQIAQAGGTTNAIAGAAGSITTTMNMIREQELAALPCEYDLPDRYAEFSNPDLVNLTFNGEPRPRVDGPASCDGAGQDAWHYDDPIAPSRIIACPSTCGTFKQGGGAVNIALGCPTVVVE